MLRFLLFDLGDSDLIDIKQSLFLVHFLGGRAVFINSNHLAHRPKCRGYIAHFADVALDRES